MIRTARTLAAAALLADCGLDDSDDDDAVLVRLTAAGLTQGAHLTAVDEPVP